MVTSARLRRKEKRRNSIIIVALYFINCRLKVVKSGKRTAESGKEGRACSNNSILCKGIVFLGLGHAGFYASRKNSKIQSFLQES